jgi:peptidyl-prolyl cis-trans isomerase SurA
MKSLAVCTLLLLDLLIWVPLPVHGERELYSDRIAAVVNGDVILASDIKSQRQPIIRNISALPLGIVPPGKWPTEKEILDELIVQRLLEQEADRKGVTVDDKAVEASIESIKKRNNMTQDKFVLFLSANGLSYPEYLKIMKRQFRLRKLISGEVSHKVALSEEDAQEYFKQNRGQIDTQYEQLVKAMTAANPPEEQKRPEVPTHVTAYVGGHVRLRQITLAIPEGANPKAKEEVVRKARKIYEEASSGADFAKLAKQYSQDPNASKGGDLGLVAYKDLRTEVQNMVQRMKKGDVTPPIMTSKAVLVFCLDDEKGRKETKLPIPAHVRKQLEKQMKETYEKRAAEAGRGRGPADPREKADEPPKESKREAGPTNPAQKPVKSLGILTPAEEKEYQRQREKVIAILRTNKTEARMKEWIEELKKNSIIEVRL